MSSNMLMTHVWLLMALLAARGCWIWLEWTGMRAKVPKCYSLAIKASSGKRYDPQLLLSGKNIPFIGDQNIQFLGGPISMPQLASCQRNWLRERLDLLLQRVEAVPVTRKQKLLLYKAGICPQLCWDLSITTLPLSWVKTTLEAKATKYLKRWSGLARSADPARLYLPRTDGGLQLLSLSVLYEKLQCSQAALLLTSQDGITRLVTSPQTQREKEMERISFRPLVLVRDIMAQDPGMRRSVLGKRAKLLVAEEESAARLEHARSLPQQGELLRDTPDQAAAKVWCVAVGNLSSSATKFILNAACDTLPHNSNLSLWGRGVPSGCPLCGQKQALLHIFNHCPVALELRRFNHRHDAVLIVISELVRANLTPSQEMIADLPGSTYQYPQHISCTDARPDIVV